MSRIIACFLIFLLLALSAWWLLRPEPALQVETVQIQRGDIHTSLDLTGNVINDKTVSVTALLDGQIVSVKAGKGESVASLQPLALIDSQIAAAELEKAQAELQYQKRHLQVANATYSRLNNLLKKGSGTRQAQEDALLEKRRVEAALSVAEADLVIRQLHLENASVEAPFAGVVVDRFVEAGQWVEAGAALFTLVAEKGRVVEMQIDAGDVDKVSLDQVALLTIESRPEEQWQSQISWIAPAITQGRGSAANSVAVRVPLDNGPADVLLQQQIDVQLMLESKTDVLLLDQAALQRRGNERFVYLFNEGQATRRVIETGMHSINVVEIVSGLNEGDTVIVPGLQRLDEGQRVESR